MDQPLISVIIPVYNMELYLERCLDSVLNNTYRNLEVICIDDGSKDGSLAILRRYESADPRVVVIAKENGGVSSARNAGLDRMTGDFVTFVDPDDYVHPQYVELLLDAQRLSNANIIIGEFQHTGSGGLPMEYPCFLMKAQDVTVHTVVDSCKYAKANSGVFSRLISRDTLGSIRFDESFSYGEDTFFFLDLYTSQQSAIIGFIPFEIYFYFERSDSLVHTRRDHDVIRYLSTLAERSSITGNERIYLEVLIRRGLYFRYYYSYIQSEATLSCVISKLLRQQIKRLVLSNCFPFRFKALRTLFILSPKIDRKYRFYRDPSLKYYEQHIKKN